MPALKTYSTLMLLLALSLFLQCSTPEPIPEATHPNIVFILADDLGYGDVSAYNPVSQIQTPHIDRLAKEGIRFTNAHSPSAVCTPTRYGILTGRYAWRGILKRSVIEGNQTPIIEKGRTALPALLQQHGYRTACIGKWHLGMVFQNEAGNPARLLDQDGPGWQIIEDVDFTKPVLSGPQQQGFDYSFATPGCPSDDFFNFYVENGTILGPIEADEDTRNWVDWEHERVDTTLLYKGMDFINQHTQSNSDAPFFLYLPLSVPHIPWAPPGFVEGTSGAGNRGDQVVLADWIVGQLVHYLDSLDLSDNTLFIFASDNGPNPNDPSDPSNHQPAGQFRGSKGMIWEGGHRIPLIIKWPGHTPAGRVNDEKIGLIDLYATFADLVGDSLGHSVAEDSYNMLPYFLGNPMDQPIRKDIIFHSGDGVFAIQSGQWKLITDALHGGYQEESPVPGTAGQLYDMKTDPLETTNLWADSTRLVNELEALLKQYQEQEYSRGMD